MTISAATGICQFKARRGDGDLPRDFKKARGSPDAPFVVALISKLFQGLDRRRSAAVVPFDIRERQHTARILRRARIASFVGTVMVLALLACGLAAMTVIRLSNDPNYVRPW